ncbi:jg5774 [Pararge aegeria aegeria]|uniref:Jg5774 protein n=1 Tax=Pararge aegeria aegeria TaxID=348720 RepID=A0A8S4SGQ4_9NEOP|nr:jg5774 [Pararge aegeria aegeria]
MKIIFAAFLALAVGANAFPQDYEIDNRQPRIIEGQIRKAFDDISNAIRDNGLDPAQIIDYEVRTTVQPGITAQGTDYSDELNDFLNVRLPRWFVLNKVAIESALAEFVKNLLNELLN